MYIYSAAVKTTPTSTGYKTPLIYYTEQGRTINPGHLEPHYVVLTYIYIYIYIYSYSADSQN